MFYRVVITRQALRDLAQLRGWLLQPGSGPAAQEKLTRIQRALDDLASAPLRWPVGVHPDIREMPVVGYRVIYKVFGIETGDEAVWILRVFGPHQSRNQL